MTNWTSKNKGESVCWERTTRIYSSIFKDMTSKLIRKKVSSMMVTITSIPSRTTRVTYYYFGSST